MLRIALGIALVAGSCAPSQACWVMLAPGVLEGRSPIIVRGKIVAVQAGKPGQNRADDFADIEIAAILKNELKDVPLKVGDKFTVRMISLGNNLKVSTDLNYALETDAIWLIELNAQGEFRIDGHPDRKRGVDSKLVLNGQQKDKAVKIGAVPDDGKVTKAEWIKRIVDDAKREKDEREKYEAERRAISEIAAELAKAESIDADSMRRHQKASIEQRRSVLQLRGIEQPLKGERLVEVCAFVLATDPDENVRTHAACTLGYSGLPLESAAGAVLAKALKDRADTVRMFACQALGQRLEKGQIAAIRPLLKDEKKDVREMAATVLGRLGEGAGK